MNGRPTTTWGRVGDDGTVYVRTRDGERAVGQWPDGDPEEALRFFARRFDGLAVEVDLLERRVRGGTLSPDEASAAMRKVRHLVMDAQAVGDLDGLLDRIDALGGVVDQRRAERRAERQQRLAEGRRAKEALVAESERVANGTDWRGGANRMRDLLEQWKALPRLDKQTDDELWHRFSSARTTYTRRRKQHFAQLNEQREAARATKQRLLAEAESLSGSTDWGPTSSRYRDLMRQWKAAGPAPKDAEESLWRRFRTAQDAFFSARDAANSRLDAEYSANAQAKRALLDEAEKLVPVTDARAAREAFRSISERWDAIGRVPRDQVRSLEGRLRAVDQAIREREQDRWRRSNPEARARAADTTAQLEASLSDLRRQRAEALQRGDQRRVAELDQDISTRQAWLDQTRAALDEFSPDSD